jgi:CheY-like chemotaxis protein
MDFVLPKKPKGVFVFIDDNPDEHVLIIHAMKSLSLDNQIVCCMNGKEALQYLKETQDLIFIIISDIHMPEMDGLELKRMIDDTPELKIKAIPFVFHSSTSNPTEIKTAYTLNIQGFMEKSHDSDGIKKTLFTIIRFWVECLHPSQFR